MAGKRKSRRGNSSSATNFEHRIHSTLITAPPAAENHESTHNGEDLSVSPTIETYTTATSTLSRGKRRRKKGQPEKLSYKERQEISTIQGRRVVRLGVLQVPGHTEKEMEDFRSQASITGKIASTRRVSTRSFSPKTLLDIESGKAILFTQQKIVDHHQFEELKEDGAIIVTAKSLGPDLSSSDLSFSRRKQFLRQKIQTGDITDFEPKSEIGIMGGFLRGIVRRILAWCLDDINSMRVGRRLEAYLPYLPAYEAYLLGQVIEAVDGPLPDRDVGFILQVAFRNRKVSLILIQAMGPRLDYMRHWYQALISNRYYELWDRVPLISSTTFPPTENTIHARKHIVTSLLRTVFGDDMWLVRVLTRNRPGLLTDDPERIFAQKITPDIHGVESSYRNIYSTYIARRRMKKFRAKVRMPTDEWILHGFATHPMETIVNNGAVHILRVLAIHWRKVLEEPKGTFCRQRTEQLNPFDTVRIQIPIVCVALSSLRGRNSWDARVLGPFVKKCQELQPSATAGKCRSLVQEMKEHIALGLGAGIASIVDPLRSWLDAIADACSEVEEEAKEVYRKITSVEVGLRLGFDLVTQVSWKIPNDNELKEAIELFIRGKNPGALVSERRIRSALLMTSPRDKKTLMDLVKKGFQDSRPAQMLLGRVRNLLKREIRREAMNLAIRELSTGERVVKFVRGDWYWIEARGKKEAYIYEIQNSGKNEHCFIHADSGIKRVVCVSSRNVRCFKYVPVAEAISRAQRCYMTIEVEHGNKFTYSAFMEFSFLRIALRRLAMISQVSCDELNTARTNLLSEIQRTSESQVAIADMKIGATYYINDIRAQRYDAFVCLKEYTPADPEWQTLSRSQILKVPPQSVTLIGDGPTALLAVIHCTENVLLSGGTMKLYTNDSSSDAAIPTFERAQIVRLDSRWVAMLRYYTGTLFEDTCIASSGDTEAQFGNTLPTRGVVEVTLKDLENMLHIEVSKMWSKGIVQCFTNSNINYDAKSNVLTKQANNLEIDDVILRRVDPNGNVSGKYFSWKVTDVIRTAPLGLNELRVGREYGIFIHRKSAVLPFRLASVDLQSRTYTFKSLKKGESDLKEKAHNLPSVYSKTSTDGFTNHVSKVVLECVRKGVNGRFSVEILSKNDVQQMSFRMDIGDTHVVDCSSKPHDSSLHFKMTTSEPYGFCCLQGLKISMTMHNFGERLWGAGSLDDYRSTPDAWTRTIDDEAIIVSQRLVAERMLELVKLKSWQEHFQSLVDKSSLALLVESDQVIARLRRGVTWHAIHAKFFKRQFLQARFFETRDNISLCMEHTREYGKWKQRTADDILQIKSQSMDNADLEKMEGLKNLLMNHIDRLWYDACLEMIRLGDVYNQRTIRRIPKLFTINSCNECKLMHLPVGESFRLGNRPDLRYEVLFRKKSNIIVRNSEGSTTKFEKDTLVRRDCNLTRGPDGISESEVSVVTFPVAHHVNFRAMRLNNESGGYISTSFGDAQVTSHVFHDGALTAGCVGTVLFNDFLSQAVNGVPLGERLVQYTRATNWSNIEAISQGTGSGFGLGGIMRLSFSTRQCLEFLHSKTLEYIETNQVTTEIFSIEWQAKLASSMIPSGFELNKDFMGKFQGEVHAHIFDLFLEGVALDSSIMSDVLMEKLMSQKRKMDILGNGFNVTNYWNEYLVGIEELHNGVKTRLENYHIEGASKLQQIIVQIVDFSKKCHLYDNRDVTEADRQPKSVDSIVDSFAVEAHEFVNPLSTSVAFSAGALAFVLFDMWSAQSILDIVGSVLVGLNIIITFRAMCNALRYKIRNEEARVLFFDDKLMGILKAVFMQLPVDIQETIPVDQNPYIDDLKSRFEDFESDAGYYGMPITSKDDISAEWQQLLRQPNDPSRVKTFQDSLLKSCTTGKYQSNSHLKETILGLYKVCEEMSRRYDKDNDKNMHQTRHLFSRLSRFKKRLSESLQRGHLYAGIAKQRSIRQWDFFVVIRYFLSRICYASSEGVNPLAPIQVETLGILREARKLSTINRNKVLRREICDLEYLSRASRESDIASLVIMASFSIHLASWIFVISRIVLVFYDSSKIWDAISWASLASTPGAILLVFHFHGKCFTLLKLWCILGFRKRRAPNMAARAAVGKIRAVTFAQLLVTFLRLIAVLSSAASLPWSVMVTQFSRDGLLDENIPFWVALGSVGAILLALAFSFLVHVFIRYHLSPRLGENVCEAFREDIEAMYNSLAAMPNAIETTLEQERETWNYVARGFLHRYRFDLVFSADHLGQILQYVQGGFDPRTQV